MQKRRHTKRCRDGSHPVAASNQDRLDEALVDRLPDLSVEGLQADDRAAVDFYAFNQKLRLNWCLASSVQQWLEVGPERR